LSKNNHVAVTPRATRAPQQSNYYGKNIGQPVKVQPQMRQPSQHSAPAHMSTGRTDTHGSSGSGGGGENHERR
jgi:hypothetical protein